MISAWLSIGVFGFLTVAYFLAKFFFIDRKGPPVPSGTGATILSLMYVVLVVGSQLFINVRNSAALCNDTPQIVTSFIYTIIPNFFILGLIMIIMKILPGWKSPFSNTIGYLTVYMLGVGGAFSDLLKSKKTGELIQKICDNQSIVINEITPFNFELFLNKMNKDKLLKSNYRSKPAYHKLWEFVVLKDSIAEFMWIGLCGALVISTTFNAIMELSHGGCDIPTAQRKAAAAKFEAQTAKSKSEESKPKLFTVQD
jgi:hypothetical protein